MGVYLIHKDDTSNLRDISELLGVEMDVNKVTSSTEALTPQIRNTPLCEEVAAEGRENKSGVYYTKIIDPTTKAARWSFNLLSYYYPAPWWRVYVEFILQMDLVKPQDSVHITIPHLISEEGANALASAIITCKSKDITIAGPMIFNLGAAYVLSFAKTIEYNPNCCMFCQVDEVGSYGKLKDIESASAMYKNQQNVMLERLKNKNLLTESEVNHIKETQGGVACYCGDLLKRYQAFNNQNK